MVSARRAPAFVALLAAAGLACAPRSSPSPDTRTGAEIGAELGSANLLLITVDTLRADHVGAYGDARAQTRAIDRLASGGVRFANCYSPVPLTLPSHSTLFTGRYPFALDVRNNGSYALRPEETTLAERLQQRGYRTAAFVSSYVLASKFGLAQGFSTYDDRLDDDDLIHGLGSQVPADRVADRFIAWLDGERRRTPPSNSPYFAWLHFYDPHLPYDPPEPFRSRFAEDLYRGEIAFTDAQIERALAAAENAPGAERTLTVLLSDHGESFGEHGEIGHGILTYEESLRVPLILAGPGLPAGATIESRARLLDLAPTVLELLGFPPPEHASGASLVPVIAGEDQADRDVYFESVLGAEDYNWAPVTGVIAGVEKYFSLPQPELYDLEADPGESENLARILPGRVEEMEDVLRRLLLAAAPDANRDPGPNRELSAEDLAHLRALGYLGQADRSSEVIDPKQGIRIDAEVKRIRGLLDAGDLTAADSAASALAVRHERLRMVSLYALRHEIAVRRGDALAAVEILETGLEALPDSPRLLFLLAHYLQQSGRQREAEAACRRLLAVDPGYSQAYALLGGIEEARGNFVAAIANYDRALADEPGNRQLRVRRAEALLRTGDLESALSAFEGLATEGALEGRPVLLYKVAMLNAQAGNGSRAEALFRKGLAESPGGVHHLTFALLLLDNGKRDEALEHLRLAIEQYPGELSAQQLELARNALAGLEQKAGLP